MNYKNTFYFITVSLYFFFSLSTYAQGKKEDAAKGSDKIYTEDEFNEKMKKLLFEKLKRLGPENVVELSRELYEKEKALELKLISMKQKEEQVSISEKDLAGKIRELQKREEKILACLDEHDGQEKKRVSHMVDAISGMRPQNAADVLSVQDPDISVKILGRLPASKVSKIFNSMKKEISARLQKQYMSMKR